MNATTENLVKQKIKLLYLDDEMKHIENFKHYFVDDENYQVLATNSISEAFTIAVVERIDIFICDLKLDNIMVTEKGTDVLFKMRLIDPSIYLGILTAFSQFLNTEILNKLKRDRIKVYHKGDVLRFQLQLEKDYSIYKSKQFNSEVNNKIKAMDILKDMVLKHLKNVTNQDVIVPIPGFRDITVNDLQKAVINDEQIGEQYKIEWLYTLNMINDIRDEGKRND